MMSHGSVRAYVRGRRGQSICRSGYPIVPCAGEVVSRTDCVSFLAS